jgi:hypothetical protein
MAILFQIQLPELARFPAERQKSIWETFNSLPSTAALRDKLGKLPSRLGSVLMMVVIPIMTFVYDEGVWPCMLAGFLCFVVGVPVGMVFKPVLELRAFRRYIRKISVEGRNEV